MIRKLNELLSMAMGSSKKILSVAAAQDDVVLESVLEAVELNIIDAILVGDEEKIKEIAKREGLDLSGVRIVDEKNLEKCAERAVALVTRGEADFIMKGLITTGMLLKAVLNKEAKLRTDSLISHVMIYEPKNYHKLLFLTDGGMVPYPELKDKIGIIKNAVWIAHLLGIDEPKVAPICAVETVNPSMQATVDASALTIMNKRGQLNGCIIDGPLALDNAVSKEAARHKGITSPVAGEADILLVPNIEAGNFLGKALTYFGEAENAGVIVGAKCPVVLVSRADSEKAKLYSIALGKSLCKKE